MKAWLERMLFSNETVGEKIFSVAIVVFAFLFAFFWMWLILNFILNSILAGIKWLHEKRKGYDPDFEYKIYLAEEKLEQVFQVPYRVAPNIFKRFNLKSQININLIKSILLGIAIPVIGVWIWYVSSDNPLNEYLLITKSQTVNGQITEVQEYDEIVEYNDGRSAGQAFYFEYKYNFRLANGLTIGGVGREDGTLPEYLRDVAENPYQTKIEYLPDNPGISRVKGMSSGNKTIYEWLRYSILSGVIVLLVCSYFAFIAIDRGIKKYRNSKKNLSSNNTIILHA